MESESPRELVLASSSPRRRDLLREAGYHFRVEAPGVEENEDTRLPIRLLTSSNASLKADAVAQNHPDAVVVAADTLVLLGEKVFSKPTDRAEATRMLTELNGQKHEVFTAVAIRDARAGKSTDFTVTTQVYFRHLDPGELTAYHALVDPMDKAGAYAAQEHGEMVIARIEGAMSNVIGLPMEELTIVLRDQFGISPATTH